jgi:hypothetical protein
MLLVRLSHGSSILLLLLLIVVVHRRSVLILRLLELIRWLVSSCMALILLILTMVVVLFVADHLRIRLVSMHHLDLVDLGSSSVYLISRLLLLQIKCLLNLHSLLFL